VSHEATDLVPILDESGSMAHLRADPVGGVNTFIEEHRKQPGDAYVTTRRTNTSSRTSARRSSGFASTARPSSSWEQTIRSGRARASA
jgi:hypothetical protein